MLKLVLIFLVATLSFSSCIVQRNMKSEARTIEATRDNFYKMPLIGDVTVDLSKKITGIAATKELAIQQAVEAAGVDFIIDPVFDTNIFGAVVSVKVIGYGASYKEIKTATPEELEALYAADLGIGDPSLINKVNQQMYGNESQEFSSSPEAVTGFPYRNANEYDPAYRAEKGIGDRPLTGKEKRERNYFFFYYKSVEKRKAKGKRYNEQHPSVAREKSMKAGKILLGVYALGAIIALIALI